MRIASLLATGTEIAWALGLGDSLVAISHECDYPPEDADRPRITRPRFDPQGLGSAEVDAAVREAMETSGSVYEIDEAGLRAARPDLVLTQAVCDVCAVPAADARAVVDSLESPPRVLSLDAHTIDGIFMTILQVGEAAGVARAAAALVFELRDRLQRIRERVADRPRPTVLGIEWLDPPFTPGHWVPEMVETAGAINLEGQAGARSQQVSWERLMGLDPDVLLIMPCGYKLDATRADADRYADRLLAIAPRAIDEGRAFVVDGSSYFNRSGPRVVDGVEILAKCVHPDAFPNLDVSEKGAVWRPIPQRT